MNNTPCVLVTTGPESSGKTTIARELQTCLKAPLVTECSRDYLNELYRTKPGLPYKEDDLLGIARLQNKLEQDHIQTSPPWLICDTDLLVIIIWSEVRFGRCHPQIHALFEQAIGGNQRLYLLCDPEIPWEADPLRENPQDREALLQRYKQKLEAYQLPYLHLRGSPAQRLQAVKTELQG